MKASRMFFAVCAVLMTFFMSMVLQAPAAAEDQSAFNEWLDARLVVTFADSMTGCRVNGTFDVHKMGYQNITCKADDLRNVYAAGSSDDRWKMVDALENFIDDQSASMVDFFSGDATITPHDAACDVSTLAQDSNASDAYNPVRFYKDFDISFKPSFFKMSNESQMKAVRAFLVMGAKVTVSDIKLSSNNGWNTTFKYVLPQGFSFESTSVDNASCGTPVIGDGGASVSQTIDNVQGGRGQCLLNMTISYDNAPALSSRIEVAIDMKTLEADVFKIISGSMQATSKLEISVDVYMVNVPSDMEIPATINMRHINSDALRLALNEGLIERRYFDNIKEKLLGTMSSALEGMAGGELTMELDEEALKASLDVPVDVNDMRGGKPIVFKVKPFEITLGTKKSGVQAALVNLPKFSFSFPPMDYGDVTYRIIFPSGIEVVSVEGATAGKTSDGRQYIKAEAASGTSTQISVVMGVGFGFILGAVWPFLVGILLVVAVIIAVAVIRRAQKKTIK